MEINSNNTKFRNILKILMLVTLIFLTSCSNANKNIAEKNVATKAGYKTLTDSVYVNSNLKLNIEKDMYPIYGTENASVSDIKDNLMGEYNLALKDSKEGIILSNEEVKFSLGSKYNVFTWIKNTKKGNQSFNIFNALLTEKLENKENKINFKSSNFSDEKRISDLCFEFLKKYNLYSMGKFEVFSINMEEYKSFLERYNKEDEKDFSINEELIQPFYMVKFLPEIENIDIVDKFAHFGSPENLNFSSGPTIEFIVNEDGIDSFAIVEYITPNNDTLKQIKVGKVSDIEAFLTKKFSEVLQTNEIFIEDIRLVYAPLSIGDFKYNYKPIWEISYKTSDGIYSRIFYDFENEREL